MPNQPQHPATPPPPPAPPHPPEEKTLTREDAKQLFLAGHRLHKKGDPPEKWIATSRVHGVMCLCKPLDDVLEKAELETDLVLTPD